MQHTYVPYEYKTDMHPIGFQHAITWELRIKAEKKESHASEFSPTGVIVA